MVRQGLAGVRIGTLTLGCKVNQYETDSMRELLEAAGAELTEFEDEADVYLVNTCSVTNMAERKSRQMLHRARKKNADALVVAVGCYVQTTPKEVLNDLSVDIVVGNNRKKEIATILEDAIAKRNLSGEACHWLDINRKAEYESLTISHMTEHTRAYIKIQDGCNQFCSYCIIPYVRGRIRSRAPEEVLEEIEHLAEQGCKEVVLTGIHLSSYGKDWEQETASDGRLNGVPLLQLIQRIDKIEGICRIRLGSLEPRIMTEAFVTELAKVEKLCPHFHLSLQSACDETLKRMNRKYTIEEYMEGCERLRKAFDRPALTTDVIVGFPGETEEEFETTYENLKKLNLYEMHIFKYSRRRGTRAEQMPNQIPEPVKTLRSDRLLELTAEQKKRYEDSFCGEIQRVLVEECLDTEKKRLAEGCREEAEAGKQWYVGHTERYQRVTLQSERDVRNQIVEVIGS